MASNKEFAEGFKKRTKDFAVSIIKLCRKFPNNRESNIISNQLIRCSTSVASNYRAACRARSGKEFFAKLCIVVEEADESLFWLELLQEIDINIVGISRMIEEGTEIVSIAATSRKTAGKNL